jgi:hypothetical protein
MPLPHETPVFSVDNAAITPLLTDPVGGTATYGTKINFPGIREAGFNPDLMSKELFGDNYIIARAGKVRQVKTKIGVAKMNLDILAAILGGAVTDTGTTPNMVATYNLLGTDKLKYFKLEYRVLGVELPSAAGGGDLHVVYWKCMIEATSQDAKMEDFTLPTFDVCAIPRLADSKMVAMVANETAIALA